MWAWIKAHKWLVGGLIAGAVILYYVLKHRGGGSSSGEQDVSGYGAPSVMYNGGGIPMNSGGGGSSSAPSTNTNAPPAASEPATYQASPGASGPQVTAGYTADGRPYSNADANNLPLPTGAGWNQGTQAEATLGMGGTALPTASGDFTIAGNSPGVWLNKEGYSSQASLAANHAAVEMLGADRYESALTRYAEGKRGGPGTPTDNQPQPLGSIVYSGGDNPQAQQATQSTVQSKMDLISRGLIGNSDLINGTPRPN